MLLLGWIIRRILWTFAQAEASFYFSIVIKYLSNFIFS